MSIHVFQPRGTRFGIDQSPKGAHCYIEWESVRFAFLQCDGLLQLNGGQKGRIEVRGEGRPFGIVEGEAGKVLKSFLVRFSNSHVADYV